MPKPCGPGNCSECSIKGSLQTSAQFGQGGAPDGQGFLLSGDPGSADTAMGGHNRGQFEDSPESQEVDRIFGCAANAVKEMKQAIELAGQSGKEEEAVHLMIAFPSKDDRSNLWEIAPEKAKHGHVLAIISLPRHFVCSQLRRYSLGGTRVWDRRGTPGSPLPGCGALA